MVQNLGRDHPKKCKISRLVGLLNEKQGSSFAHFFFKPIDPLNQLCNGHCCVEALGNWWDRPQTRWPQHHIHISVCICVCTHLHLYCLSPEISQGVASVSVWEAGALRIRLSLLRRLDKLARLTVIWIRE